MAVMNLVIEKLLYMIRLFKYMVILVSLNLCLTKGHAQDQAVFNHYVSNQGILNPAYNGTRDIVSGLLVHRNQWLGMKGAPMSDALNVHAPVEHTDLGVGIVLMNDNIGFTNNLEFFAACSYKLKLDRKHTLSLALQAGFKNVIYDATKAVTVDYGDPVFDGKISKFGFNFGFGAYWYSSKYFAGLSIPRFFVNKYNTDKQEIKNTVDFSNLHSYMYGGYIFDINDLKVKTTALFRVVPGAPVTMDISAQVLLMEKLWLGLSYRTVTDLIFLAEYQIDKKWAVKYSFDYPLNSISKYAKMGTHELGVQFDFSLNKRPGMRSIRYF